MAKKRVLLDVDGVIADFTGLYLDIANRVTGRDYKPSQIDQWDIGKALKLTPEELVLVHRFLFAPGAAYNIEPYKNARTVVGELHRDAELWFVTSPMSDNPTWVFDRKLWFERYFSKELSKRVIHADQKSFVKGDVFVDDKPENITGWCIENPTGVAFLWEASYNRDFVLQKAWTASGVQHLPSRAGVWHEVQRIGRNAYSTSSWQVVQDFIAYSFN